MPNSFRQVDAKLMFSCSFSLQFLTLCLFCSNFAFFFFFGLMNTFFVPKGWQVCAELQIRGGY